MGAWGESGVTVRKSYFSECDRPLCTAPPSAIQVSACISHHASPHVCAVTLCGTITLRFLDARAILLARARFKVQAKLQVREMTKVRSHDAHA